jgi:hypothetical protein
MAKWLLGLTPSKQNFSFICTMTCLIGLFLLAIFKDVDIVAVVPVVLGAYLGARTADKAVAVSMASKDAKCDTRGVINDLEFGPGSYRGKPIDNPDA